MHTVQGATSVLFFEARKRSDLYLWMAKVPSGPSIRFLCTNVHTMAELKLSGNHLKGSRPVLSFDAAFDEQPQLQVCFSSGIGEGLDLRIAFPYHCWVRPGICQVQLG